MRLFLSLFLLLFLANCYKNPTQNHLPPELQEALASIEIMDGFQIELIAAEPLVADPVAMEIDENGNLYVVEMHGYPLDLSRSGLIKQLRDTNGDGFPDESIVFADSLTLPTGIMRWRDGFLVTDAPHVLYLEDTDGDGRADTREIILTGFALSNPQHNLNTPRFELDNWIYLAHENAVTPFVHTEEFGDRGEPIRFPGHPDAPELGVNANGKAVRFKPDELQVEALSGKTQFGHTADAWGHRIYTSNADHLYHEVLTAPYLNMNPHLLISETTQDLPDHGAAAKVFPITENPNHQLLTDVGVITSSCGVTWYDGGAFGEPFERVTFVAESVHNLVHADVLEDDGASFTAKRLLEEKEFLASTDPWFRPVNFYVGPDGALYLLDYYRQIVEHPEWMSEEVNQSGALYNGADKGRLYRITPKSGLPMDWLGRLDLADRNEEELVKLLDHANGWYRRTAQRLLYQRSSEAAAPFLKALLKNARHAAAKPPALWLLRDLGQLDEPDLLTALNDPEAGVRENALKVLETRPDLLESAPDLKVDLLALQKDPSAKVRYQLLCTSALLPALEAEEAQRNILQQDIEDRWVSIVAIAAASGEEAGLLEWAETQLGAEASPGKETFFAHLGSTIANSGDRAAFQRLLQAPDDAWWKAAAFSGVSQLWRYRGATFALNQAEKEQLLRSFQAETPAEWRKTALELLAVTGLPSGQLLNRKRTEATAILNNPAAPSELKADAIRLLGLTGAPRDLLQQLLAEDQPELVQTAALQSLRNGADEQLAQWLLQEFGRFQPNVRSEAIQLFFAQPAMIHLLLDAIDSKQVSREDLGWRRTVRLMNYYDEDIRAHARRVLAINEDRKAVLQQYLPALELEGNAAKGKQIFERLCAVCHQIDGVEGIDFGPNLSTLRSRNPHSIVTEIINPNNSIADQYENWEITLKNGTNLSGILEQDNAQTMVLKQQTGERVTLEKSSIASAQKSALSAMPNGLENSISVEEMADLVAFIKGGE
jgi:putative membrane-bound dehydrogenase-like protein